MKATLTECSVCHRIADRLANDVGSARYERYFRDCAKLRLGDGRLHVSVPSGFYATWLGTRFGASLQEAARSETGDAGLSLEWSVEPGAFENVVGLIPPPEMLEQGTSEGKSAPEAGKTSGRWPGSAWRNPGARREAVASERYTLEGFIVGRSNRLAYDAAMRLSAPETPPFKLLFIHGECGVGKTHLLNGLSRRYSANHPGARVRCQTGEQFTNEYITAVKAGKLEVFRASVRRLDMLCLDDMHFFSGRDKTQQEFMHTFDALDMSGARAALVSDAHPREIANINERLVSRCLSGMVVKIERPDEATRAEIVRRLTAGKGLRLEPAAVEALAALSLGSVRDIEGALARVEAFARLLPEALGPGGEVSASTVKRALGETAGTPRLKKPVKVLTIADTVCRALGVDLSEVLGRGRHKRVVLARSMTAYLARELTTQSFPEIAAAMNRPNHSTIVTACQRTKKQIESGVMCEGEGAGVLVSASELFDRLRQLVQRTTAAG